MPTLTGVVLAAGLLAAAQQRPSFSYEVVVESAATIERTLRDLSRDGNTCAAVARPGGGPLSNNVAVIVSQPARSAPPPPRSRATKGADGDVMVITATAGTPEALERDLNAAAQEGFSLCGLTMTGSIWGRPSEYATVAVMTRAGTS